MLDVGEANVMKMLGCMETLGSVRISYTCHAACYRMCSVNALVSASRCGYGPESTGFTRVHNPRVKIHRHPRAYQQESTESAQRLFYTLACGTARSSKRPRLKERAFLRGRLSLCRAFALNALGEGGFYVHDMRQTVLGYMCSAGAGCSIFHAPITQRFA